MANFANLFPSNLPSAAAQSNTFVTFKAGKLNHKPIAGTPRFKVEASKEKGQLTLLRGGDGAIR